MAEKEERKAVAGDADEQRRWRKAYWLVHSYLDQKAVCEQCRQALAALPRVTWQDAVDSLTGGGSQFTERVQTSNISDPTAKAALNADREIERLEREMREEFEKPLRAAERNISVLNTVFLKVELRSKRDDAYRDTLAFVLQFCKRGVPLEQVKRHDGAQMSRYRAKAEMHKVTEIIAEELFLREEAKGLSAKGCVENECTTKTQSRGGGDGET